MPIESFGQEWGIRQERLARAAETAASADNDGSRLIDPIVNIPGQRPAPEGLLISFTHRTEEILEDDSWQHELGSQQQPYFLKAEFEGQRAADLSAELIISKSWEDATAETDRYVRLGNIQVYENPNVARRKRGIGSALLGRFERDATRFGASRIEGIIAAVDIQETPGVPDFYRHRGYELTQVQHGYTFVKRLQI